MIQRDDRTSWATPAGLETLFLKPGFARPADPAGSPAAVPAVLDLATLDGTNGVRLDGVDAEDESGTSVSCAGDVNGDGFDDIVIGAPNAGSDGSRAGESYVVFGRADGIPASFDLAALDGKNGFRIEGVDTLDRCGFSVASAGDVNGDGFDDVVIGAYRADSGDDLDAGQAYVVFGKAGGRGGEIDLATLNGKNGFRITGVDAQDLAGFSVSSAGDVNGDGFDDIVIGAPVADGFAGASYVVFGKSGGRGGEVDLAMLNGRNGFRIDAVADDDQSGLSVASAGDVNGDGFDDIVIGASAASRRGNFSVGESYVVFGHGGGFAPVFDLAALDGGSGFRIVGLNRRDYNGASVSSAGDFNGDGFADVIIGARGADPGGESRAGESYVVFGHGGDFAASLYLAALDGANGFRVEGVDAGDYSGVSVSSAGDFNGDGFDDLIVGAHGADAGGGFAGSSYVVFGKAGGFAASLDLTRLDGINGFRIDGVDVADGSGRSVSAAGDVNADGFDDIVIGAPGADHGGESDAGESYVIFGRAPPELSGDDPGDAIGRLFLDVGTGGEAHVPIAALHAAPLAASDLLVI